MRKTCARRRNTSLRSTRVTPISAQRSYPISYIFRANSYPTQAAIRLKQLYISFGHIYPIGDPISCPTAKQLSRGNVLRQEQPRCVREKLQ